MIPTSKSVPKARPQRRRAGKNTSRASSTSDIPKAASQTGQPGEEGVPMGRTVATPVVPVKVRVPVMLAPRLPPKTLELVMLVTAPSMVTDCPAWTTIGAVTMNEEVLHWVTERLTELEL